MDVAALIEDEVDRVLEILKADESPPQLTRGLVKEEDILVKNIKNVIGGEFLRDIMNQLRQGTPIDRLKLNIDVLRKLISTHAITGYDKAQEIIKTVAGGDLKIDFNKMSMIESATKRLIEEKGLILANRVSQDVINKVQDAIIDGISKGKGIDAIAREIRKTGLESGTFSSVADRAEAIARTEIIGAAKQAQLDAVKASVIPDLKTQLLTALTACPVCLEIAKRGPISEEEARALGSIHPNCRCSWLPAVPALADVFKSMGITVKVTKETE